MHSRWFRIKTGQGPHFHGWRMVFLGTRKRPSPCARGRAKARRSHLAQWSFPAGPPPPSFCEIWRLIEVQSAGGAARTLASSPLRLRRAPREDGALSSLHTCSELWDARVSRAKSCCVQVYHDAHPRRLVTERMAGRDGGTLRVEQIASAGERAIAQFGSRSIAYFACASTTCEGHAPRYAKRAIFRRHSRLSHLRMG